LLWAAHLANLTGGRLIVLHVVHDPADQPGYYRRNRENRLQPMERAADEMFDAFLADVRQDHVSLPALERAEKTVVDGLPPTRIVEMASRLDAALIVIGRRGRTRLPQLLQGSVSKRVVQLATVPVVVVKAGKPRAKDG
jgi:nucleotide-binding universal stress UspA family protein